MNRVKGILLALAVPLLGMAQGGDQQLRVKADALFTEGRFAEAYPLYSQLVSLNPSDRELNYRFGACTLYGGDDKEKAIGHLKFACDDPTTPPLAWYFLGRSYHLAYRFKEALVAYERYKGTADRKVLAQYPADALEQQCRNGLQLLSNLKDIEVHNKLEVDAAEFFRFYDLSGIGGRIVVTPDELRSALDKKSAQRSLIFLPEKGGPIYFSSLGKDGRTGRDIYRTEVLPTGEFATPVKLAGYVNTDQDEDYPFLSADGRFFYFASKGHNSMGGYDVFRASYDKGLDVFGAPENLDFAVNTPDDDIFYMVDPEGREACFASGRSSHQGKLHVYRVSTTQTPISIAVLKGTFASEIEPGERRAHITVEDAMTRERVADVRTDINGNYVLALPRSGRYRFMVEAGAGGRTHVGYVEVPRSESARGYRQEMSLVEQASQEKLLIRNYFDEPLAEDLIALALDEIKRRARMDVSTTPPVAEGVQAPAPVGDVLTAAGFTGEVTKEGALKLAEQDVRDREGEAQELGRMSEAAYSLALDNAAESERLATQAATLVAEAGAATDEAQRNERMTQAAVKRQASREANLRARAAFAAGQDLDAQRLAATQRAAEASKRSTALASSMKANDDARTVALLKELKADLDRKASPDMEPDAAEKARRAATAAEQEAAKATAGVTSASADESDLVDRINRLKRDQEATGSRSKKEEMGREIATLEQQLEAMRAEKATALAKARAAEERSTVARGQATLVRHLQEKGEALPVTELDAERVEALGQKITGNGSRIEALAIDERYDAQVSGGAAAVAARTFDWGGASSAAGLAEAGAQQTARAGDAAPAAVPATTTVIQEAGQQSAAAAQEGAATAGMTRTDDAAAAATAQEQAIPARTEAELVSMRGAGVEPPASELPDGAFVQANELAELKQLRDAERNKARRDSLDQRIAAIERGAAAATVTAQEQVDTAEQVATEEPPAGAARNFDPAMTDEALTALLYPDLTEDRDRMTGGTLSSRQRTLGLHGLELMLVDSIEAETARQLAELEADPGKAATVLPRVDRLRRMKQEHQAEAERILASADEQYAATETQRTEEAIRQEEDDRVGAERSASDDRMDLTSHVDRYVSVEEGAEGRELVYENVVEHRSPAVREAVAEKDQDLERIAALGDEIDSLETVLEGMPAGKAYDKLRDRTDKLIDQEMILRTEMGQRMAFISREEYKAGLDSLKEVNTAVQAKGLPPNEPLVLMALEMERSAKVRFDMAQARRKEADRTEDIVKRDALYREAYQEELLALRDLDKAITVNNALLMPDHVRGSSLTYAQVEQRLFGEGEEPVAVEDGRPRVVDEEVRSAPADSSAAAASTVSPALTATDLERYQRFMAADPGTARMADALAVDASVLALEGRQAREEARRLEESSLAMADLAVAKRDSAATARKRDRERLTAESLRLQQVSDSLHQASLAMEQRAQELDLRQQEVVESQAFAERLKRYYYMSNEDQLVVMNEVDHSRYFMARSRSLEQQQQADAARLEAVGGRQLSDTLLAQATALLASPDLPDGRVSEDRMAEAGRLNDRAVALRSRSDSLAAAADRLKGAAELNDRQADALLQGMAPEKSTAVVAMEQRARRIDPLIAESRALVAQVDSIKAREQALAQARTQAPAGEQAQARPVQPAITTAEGAVVAGARTTTERPATDVVPAVTAQPATEARRTTEVRAATTGAPEQGNAAALPAGAFVAPEVLTGDIFGFKEAGAAAAPIAMDAPMPKGVVFKVQVGAFKNGIPPALFSDMMPVMGETTPSGVTRYTAGLFTTPEAAQKAQALVRERGYRDAFVVAYEDGRRIPMAQAVKAMQPLAPVASAAPVVATAPVTPPPAQAAAPVDEAQVLAAYPATAEELLKQFAPPADAAAYYNDPTAAPARQVETVKGLFFTVQVGVYSKPTPLDRLFNITPLNSERTETNKIRYTTGVFLDQERARARRDEAVGLGVKDAFITAYLNGKRIPMRDARALLQKFGPSVLADPAIETR